MNKIFKFAIVLLLCSTYSIHALGQEIYVKSPITLLPTDLTASKYEHRDGNGNPCAVIKVQLPSSPNISFSGAVGEVEQNAGEYVVYVSPGISALNVLRDGSLVCTIDMNGEEILSKCTYQVVLAMKREQIFKVTPTDAKIIVNDKDITVDSIGIARISCEDGHLYRYTISAPGYESVSDHFMISSDDGVIETITKSLYPKTRKVTIKCKVKNFDIYVDDEPIDKESDGTYRIPIGAHKLRATADKYNDWEKDIHIYDEEGQTIEISLTKSNDVSNKLRTRYEIYLMAGIINSTIVDDVQSEYNYNIGIGFGLDVFLSRWVTFRPSIELMYFPCKKNENDIDSDVSANTEEEYLGDPETLSIDVPLVFSANFPLGKFNRYHFAIGAGPIVGCGLREYKVYTQEETRATRATSYSTKDSDDEKTKTFAYFHYGARISGQLTLNWFVVGANLDIRKYTGNMFNKALIVPMVSLGVKL